MFVAQVVGHSMDPVIPNGAYCLFQFKAPQLKNDRIGLFQLHTVEDPENGGSFTVKRLKLSTTRDPAGGLLNRNKGSGGLLRINALTVFKIVLPRSSGAFQFERLP
jgi:hypothetical protein